MWLGLLLEAEYGISDTGVGRAGKEFHVGITVWLGAGRID